MLCSRVLLKSWKNVSNNFIFNVLDKLCLFGDGASGAGRRRDWATQLEGEAARRRQAQEVSRRQLRGIVCHGFGLLLFKCHILEICVSLIDIVPHLMLLFRFLCTSHNN